MEGEIANLFKNIKVFRLLNRYTFRECRFYTFTDILGHNQLEILKTLYTEIIIPEAVYNEIVISGYGKPGS